MVSVEAEIQGGEVLQYVAEMLKREPVEGCELEGDWSIPGYDWAGVRFRVGVAAKRLEVTGPWHHAPHEASERERQIKEAIASLLDPEVVRVNLSTDGIQTFCDLRLTA